MLWQTVLHQSFSMVREIYLHLSAGDKDRFEKQHSTLFFSYAAPMPPIVAEKLLAIMKSGTVEVIKLAKSYSLQRDASGRGYMFLYGEPHGGMRKDHYAYWSTPGAKSGPTQMTHRNWPEICSALD